MFFYVGNKSVSLCIYLYLSAGSYSIITDHLGTLVSSYDKEGKEVWKRELDINGREKPELIEYKQAKKFGVFRKCK